MKRFLSRVGAIAAKEVLHVRRDPRTLYLALGMPVLLLLLFGFGVSFDLDHIPVAVCDQDQSENSRELIDRVFAGQDFDLVAMVDSPDAAPHLFEARKAAAALIIPAGLAEKLARGEPQRLQLLVDGADNNTASQTLAKLEVAIDVVGAELVAGQRKGAPQIRPPISIAVSNWFNPQSRSALFLVPGLTAYVLAIVAVLLTSLTVAREWERGSMQQLFSTPVSRLEIVLGKLLPYFGLGATAMLLVLTAGAWVFDVPFHGDAPALALNAALFLTGMLGQGLLISIVTKNQMVATQLATFSSVLPSMLLSGFVFPIENMPLALQLLSNLVPARYFVHALRGILLRGNGFSQTWFDTLALLIFACLVLAAATKKFKRDLE